MALEKKYEIGARICDLRKKSGMSQEELAEAIEVSPNTISNIETGNSTAKTENIERIASALEVSIDFIVRGYDFGIENDPLLQRIARMPREEKEKLSQFLDLYYPEPA